MSRKSRCSSLLQSQLWVVALVLVWISSPEAPFRCWAIDTLSQDVPLSINQTLVSSINQTFEFGLFSLGNTTNRRYYIGTWYYNITPRVYVWVGNRDAPFPSAGANGYNISMSGDGNLRVLNSTSSELWRSNTTASWGNWKAVLGDDGNLVIQDTTSGDLKLWQSFTFPTDTFLAGMRISMNETSAAGTTFRSWRSADDPGSGDYTLALDSAPGSTQLYLRGGDGRVRWRSGVFDGDYFNGVSGMRSLNQYGFKLQPMSEQGNKSVSFSYFNKTQMRFVLLPNGTETTYIYEVEKGAWNPIWQQPTRSCDFYNFCGNNSFCVRGQPADKCHCLPGFDPAAGWDEDGYLNGTSNSPFRCRRRDLLRVDNNNGTTNASGNSNSSSSQGQSGQDKPDGFQPVMSMKVPDFAVETLSVRTEEDCRESCLTNEACTAFSFINVCYVWSGDLVDMFQFTNDSSNGDLRRNATLYVRLAGSEIDRLNNNTTGGGGGTKTHAVALAVSISVAVAVTLAVIVSAAFGWRYNLCGIKDLWRRGRTVDPSGSAYSGEQQAGKEHHSSSTVEYGAGGPGEDGTPSLAAMSIAAESGRTNPPFELPMFTLDEIDSATGSFRESNTLGKGGFGHVYKGVLPGGELVAVKRLSRDSGQGQEEFKNEVALIARLQHNNLVRLQGCCVQGEERILVYEYMPNKSLDAFLFNPTKQPLLDWRKRFNIIEGIARGLLYLHRDSRLRIVHRDLKASNILLDDDMKPKISDFGMARIFGNTQNQDNTNRIVGTFGYMSPEYAMEGLFSDKSDVYSFGVLTIEIISGRKNNRFRTDDHNNLLSYAWELWDQGRAMELVDPSIHNSCHFEQVIRCVQIALLCVQDRPNDRPKMSNVVIMLGSDTAIPTRPKLPAFPAVGSPSETATGYHEEAFSNNDVTITEINGR